MPGFLKNDLKAMHETTRRFSYEKGKITLNFSLRIDTKGELKDFKELLERAVTDVTEEIDRVK
jgi:hypothetical protein